MPSINKEILKNLYNNQDPFFSVEKSYLDDNYPHTNIDINLIEFLINKLRPDFWLELGSFVGGSAVKVAQTIKKTGSGAGLICCDPFSGDVNMWDWEKEPKVLGNDGSPYRFLNLQSGIPTIYQRFLANIYYSELSDIVTPVPVTSIVAAKLLKRLFDQKRISLKPSVIYLDSAHEPDETLLELKACWNLLEDGGVLFGDDWNWASVRNDVLKFSESVVVNRDNLNLCATELDGGNIKSDKIYIYKDQWVLFK
jgi:cephalosporin hydroxylase